MAALAARTLLVERGAHEPAVERCRAHRHLIADHAEALCGVITLVPRV